MENNKDYQMQKTQTLKMLAMLTEQIKVHEKRQKADSKNWGYVGDLHRLNHLLSEAHDYLGTPEEAQ
jgi:hypothetical protein